MIFNPVVSREKKSPLPPLGKLASEYKVGDSVFLHVDNKPVEFLVVNQGIPSGSNLYDSSCDGMWLLMKDCYDNRVWNSVSSNDYANSTIKNYMDNDFIRLFESSMQAAIKTIKIPYRPGASGTTVNSGNEGLACKTFLLSAYEVGGINSSNTNRYAVDGARLKYFEDDAADKRIAYNNGGTTKVDWWLRSPYISANSPNVYKVSSTATHSNTGPTNSNYFRPALILPFDAKFDPDTNEFISTSTGGGNT